jgi:membrane protein YqaA with SNARE-associated domain
MIWWALLGVAVVVAIVATCGVLTGGTLGWLAARGVPRRAEHPTRIARSTPVGAARAAVYTGSAAQLADRVAGHQPGFP